MLVLNSSLLNELTSTFTGEFFKVTVPLVFRWILAGALMWMGARVAGLRDTTLRRAVFTAIAASGAAWLCMHGFSDVTVDGIPLGILMGLVMTWFLIQHTFKTTMARALIVWVFYAAAHFGASALGIAGGGFQQEVVAHMVR
jgi:hypothetical protein